MLVLAILPRSPGALGCICANFFGQQCVAHEVKAFQFANKLAPPIVALNVHRFDGSGNGDEAMGIAVG